jgi:DNA-binding NarL/FixJ family response regulator
VLCVDDNDMVSQALRRRLTDEPGLEWAGVVRDGAEAFARVSAVRPDIVLMDIDMPGVDTFSIVAKLSAEKPEVRVIMFSGHINPGYIDQALDCGAWGYLSKNDDVAALMDGIRKVGRGELAMSRDVEAVMRHERSSRDLAEGA